MKKWLSLWMLALIIICVGTISEQSVVIPSSHGANY
ncbi:hypothetical protein J2T12_004318 [Paenibacillus anaericanus]|nr:hypothetical protein [Paenibacillus anaericanus]